MCGCFAGAQAADRAIQVSTNSPVNHVGMSVVVDDLPPLMWHAELSRSLPDMWSGNHHRGVQLHDLRAAVIVWATRYGQRAWLRQLDYPFTRETEDAVLRTIARLDGTPFPATVRLASQWLARRMPRIQEPRAPDARPEDGLLRGGRRGHLPGHGAAPGPGARPTWYDPGRFWSGDDLSLSAGARLGGEIAVHVPSS